MGYRCSACGQTVRSGQPQLKHLIYRIIPTRKFLPNPEGHGGGWVESERREISKEIPVCQNCYRELNLPPKENPGPNPNKPTIKGS